MGFKMLSESIEGPKQTNDEKNSGC